MSASFMIFWLLAIIFIGLSIGTSIKMWMYGIHDLLLLTSPILVILIFIALPLLILDILVFHDAWIKKLFKDHAQTKGFRFKLGIVLISILIKAAPTIMGTISKGIAKGIQGKRVKRKEVNEMKQVFIDSVISSVTSSPVLAHSFLKH